MSKYIRATVSVLLLAFIAWRTNWNDVSEKFANLHIEMWFAALGAGLIGSVAAAKRWQSFAAELGFKRTLAQYTAYSFIGMYFNLVLPTSVGGDVMRIWYLDGETGRKWAALASIFLDRLSGLLVLIAFAGVGVLIMRVELPTWIHASVWGITGCAILGMLALPIVERWERVPRERREQLGFVLHLLRVPKVLCWTSFLSVLVQFTGVLSLWFLGWSLELDIPAAYYFVLASMVPLLMFLPLSINGMGVREAGTVLFLTPLGVAEGAALTLAFLWFASAVAISLLGGLVYVFAAFPKMSAPSEESRLPVVTPLLGVVSQKNTLSESRLS